MIMYIRQYCLNGNPADFYFTDYTQGDTVYSSVIRRQIADDILAKLAEAGINTISVTSGPFLVMTIAPFLNKKALETRHYTLETEQGQLNNYRKSGTYGPGILPGR